MLFMNSKRKFITISITNFPRNKEKKIEKKIGSSWINLAKVEEMAGGTDVLVNNVLFEKCWVGAMEWDKTDDATTTLPTKYHPKTSSGAGMSPRDRR